VAEVASGEAMKLPSDPNWPAWAFRTSLLNPDMSFCTVCGSLFHQADEHFINAKKATVRHHAISGSVPQGIRRSNRGGSKDVA
jgi:hypothetical protein